MHEAIVLTTSAKELNVEYVQLEIDWSLHEWFKKLTSPMLLPLLVLSRPEGRFSQNTSLRGAAPTLLETKEHSTIHILWDFGGKGVELETCGSSQVNGRLATHVRH